MVVNKEDDLVTVLRSIIGMNPAFTSPKRRVSLDTDFTLCIVCQTSSDDEINTLTRRGFPTFKNTLEKDKMMYMKDSGHWCRTLRNF